MATSRHVSKFPVQKAVVLFAAAVLSVQFIVYPWIWGPPKDTKDLSSPLLQTALHNAIQKYLDSSDAQTYANRETNVWDQAEKGSFQPYASVEVFLDQNPDCCRYSYRGSDGRLPRWANRVRNGYNGGILLENYDAAYTYEDGTRSPGVTFFYPIDRYGEILDIELDDSF